MLYFNCLVKYKRYTLFKILARLRFLNVVDYIPQVIEDDNLEMFIYIANNFTLSNKVYRKSMVFCAYYGSEDIMRYLFSRHDFQTYITYPVIEECVKHIVDRDDVNLFKIINYNFILNYRFSTILSFINNAMIKCSFNIVKESRIIFRKGLSIKQLNKIDEKIIVLSLIAGNKEMIEHVKLTNHYILGFYNKHARISKYLK